MTHYRLALLGFGNVGKALARLLARKQTLLQEQYQITFSVTGIATGRHGSAINPQGIDLEQALAVLDQGGSLNALSTFSVPADGLDFIRLCPADILFENSPVNHHTGQPAISHLKAALQKGMYAITANKGPVVHGYRELTDLAEQQGVKFRFESAVMDGAPIFSLYRETMPAAELRGFTGILNSCTNMLLCRMEEGESLEQAVVYGQSIGITETDPSADIDGWDAAIKVAALATVLMGEPMTPQQVERTGIRGIGPEQIAQASALGKRWKLVCSAQRENGRLVGRVYPQMISPTSPLYSINGTSSYVQFETDVLPGLGVVESDPGPETTAFGLLADFINAVKP